MTEDQKQQLREKVADFFEGEEFNEYFERFHSPGWLLWPVAIIAPLTIIGLGIGLKTWKMIFRGDRESRKLRDRYSKLGRDGEIIFTYVVIANQSLKYEEGASAPALVIGNFNDGNDDSEILEMIEPLAELALMGSSDGKFQKTAKLLSDIDYKFKRRRRIPEEIAGEKEVYAFDLQILGEFLPTSTLKIEAIPCLAEPGPKGLICAIPSHLIMEVLGEDPENGTSDENSVEEEEPDSVKQLSHGFIPDSLQNDRDRFCGTLFSEKGSQALTKSVELFSEGIGEKGVPGQIIVEPMRQDEFLLALITFPETKRDGDAHFGMIVLGPWSDWNKPDFEKMSYRYFLLERSSEDRDGQLTRIIDFSHLELSGLPHWVRANPACFRPYHFTRRFEDLG